MIEIIIKARKSIRRYLSKPAADADIEEIIKAGIAAPSAKNRQPWRFIVYRGRAKDNLLDKMERGLLREKNEKPILPNASAGLADAFYTLKVMKTAPVMIIIENTNGVSPFETMDAEQRFTEICDSLSIGAAIQNMLLRATELGLGTLWVANTCFAYPELVSETGIKGQLIGAVLIGYADENPAERPRKAYEELVEIRE